MSRTRCRICVHTIILLRPKRILTTRPILPQHPVPRPQLRRINTILRREVETPNSQISHRPSIAVRNDPCLDWSSGRCSVGEIGVGWARSDSTSRTTTLLIRSVSPGSERWCGERVGPFDARGCDADGLSGCEAVTEALNVGIPEKELHGGGVDADAGCERLTGYGSV